MSLHVNITKLEFAGCLMTSGYTERIRYIGPDLPNETRDIRHTTDLSKVTSIALGSRGEQFVCYGMIFKPSKRDEWVLPFARTDEGSFEKMREERIPRRARL